MGASVLASIFRRSPALSAVLTATQILAGTKPSTRAISATLQNSANEELWLHWTGTPSRTDSSSSSPEDMAEQIFGWDEERISSTCFFTCVIWPSNISVACPGGKEEICLPSSFCELGGREKCGRFIWLVSLSLEFAFDAPTCWMMAMASSLFSNKMGSYKWEKSIRKTLVHFTIYVFNMAVAKEITNQILFTDQA